MLSWAYLALGLAMGILVGEAWAFVEELARGRPVMAFLNASSSLLERAMWDGGRMDVETSCLLFTRTSVLDESCRMRIRIERPFEDGGAEAILGAAREMQWSMGC